MIELCFQKLSGRAAWKCVYWILQCSECCEVIYATDNQKNGVSCRKRSYTGELCGAEPFLRSRQLCSYPNIFQHFMDPGGSLPCSQEPFTCPCPEPDQSSLYHTILSKIHPRLGLPSGGFLSGFPTKFYMHSSYPLIRVTYPGHIILLDLFIVIILGEKYTLRSSSLCSFLQPPHAKYLYS
jgi:hypothetical protein